VRAAQGGRITVAGRSDGYGNLVVIEHAGGLTTRYAHLSVIRVAVGDAVTTGQVVGEVGITGATAHPHLHFEVRRGDVAEDPLAHLP
jgi:murein DD-endopeptidase MepM/ murein hydrolase activator NlpD